MNSVLIERFDKVITFINREGVSDLVSWLKTETDFFTAPNSTNYHCNFEDGLLTHSLNVVEYALNTFNFTVKKKPAYEYMRESVLLCAIFHDVCKINQYVKGEKFTKDSNNRWVTYQGYSVDDPWPFGHGEKSVYLINQFVKLKPEEMLAIRWHMGPSEVPQNGITKYAYEKAFNHPLLKIIQAADIASGAIEETIDYKALAIR